jgi:hypothetical protein
VSGENHETVQNRKQISAPLPTGDIICQLHGCEIYVVLRDREEVYDSYDIIGWTFVRKVPPHSVAIDHTFHGLTHFDLNLVTLQQFTSAPDPTLTTPGLRRNTG